MKIFKINPYNATTYFIEIENNTVLKCDRLEMSNYGLIRFNELNRWPKEDVEKWPDLQPLIKEEKAAPAKAKTAKPNR